MANFVVECSPQTMSLEMDFSTSAHREEGSPARTSERATLALEDPKVHKEPPQDVKEHAIKNLIEGPKVCKEPSQIDDSLA